MGKKKSHVANHPLKEKLKKLAKEMKHPFDAIVEVAKKIEGGVVKAVKGVVKLEAFVALAPFEGLMTKALKEKGITVGGTKLNHPEMLARQFVQVIILKQPAYTDAQLEPKHLEHLTGRESWSGEIELEHLYGITHAHKKHVLQKHGKKAVKHLEHWEQQTAADLLHLEHWERQYYLDLENLDILKSITGTKTAQKIIHSKHHKHHKKHLEHLYGISYNHYLKKINPSLNKIKKHLEHADAAAAITTTVEAAGAAAGIPPALTGEAVKIIQAIISYLKGLKAKAVKAADAVVKTAAGIQQDVGIPLTTEEKKIMADADDVQDTLAQTTGGTDSKGDTHFTNDNGEVSHVLHADGTVTETGAKPSEAITGRKGLFAWFYNITHKKTAVKK